jgi:AcrR family transcriptional regulator
MPRPKKSERTDTREALLDAAVEEFSRNGYWGTSLRDIARAVGVRESALYNYFPSKEALFEAMLLSHHERSVNLLAEIVDQPITNLPQLLESVARGMIERFSTPLQQKLFRIYMSDGIRLASEGRISIFDRLWGCRRPVAELMRRLAQKGLLRPIDPELLDAEFVAPLMTLRMHQAVRRPSEPFPDPRSFIRAHVDHFLRGAAANPSLLSPLRKPKTDGARNPGKVSPPAEHSERNRA